MDQLAHIERQQIRASRYWRHLRIQRHGKNQYMAGQDHVFVPWIPAFAGMTSANITTIFKCVQRASSALNAVLTGESVDSLIVRWVQFVRAHGPTLLCYGEALLHQL